MIQKKNILFLLLIILTFASCASKKGYHRRKEFLKRVFFAGPIASGPTTIFVHGTKTSLISKVVHQIDYPHGIVPRSITQKSSVMTRIGRTLSEADPQDFPCESFYYYSWPGKMTFEARLRAAQRLYDVIRDHKGPLTIITHSHGCNVALNLAFCAQKDNNTSFSVDRLILLAPPVQEVTKPFAHSPIFKRVYTFYSSADIMQVGDAQGLYWQSYAYTKPYTHIPFLSKRTFDAAPNIIQTRVLLDWQSPGHLHFLLSRFIKTLPALLKLVTKAADNDGYERTRNHFIVNIPLFRCPPHLVDPCELHRSYVPRNNYYKMKNMLTSNGLENTKHSKLKNITKPCS